MSHQNEFLLLQVNDALFPIGGYSHSYGLETYIQKGLVTNAQEAAEFIKKKLEYSILYTDLLGVRLTFLAAKAGDLAKLEELEERIRAGKSPREIREASDKMGSRFLKTLGGLPVDYKSPVFLQYVDRRKGRQASHAIAYGTFCAAVGLEEEELLRHYLYTQTSAMVTNCVKSIPLSQSAGQQILCGTYGLLEELLERVRTLSEEMFGAGTPGFDIRCMQHEGLYSRIYMS
ncbi:MAG: urease accessory protein UreF [Eubacteriales bacterium]|nr:urease accessory protein UreF [Eubacteriales bacterium]